jgi:hypothetical protein
VIKTSINSGSFGKGYKEGIGNLYELQKLFETMPSNIAIANDLAAQQTVERVKENILQRGNPGKFISVKSKKYGPLGMQIVISVDPSAGPRGGEGKRAYDSAFAARIFLNTESGMTGRSGFILPMKPRGYLISHTTVGWSKGIRLQKGPVVVPQMGSFYYSSKSGMGRIPIKQFASEQMVKILNRNYSLLLSRKGRGASQSESVVKANTAGARKESAMARRRQQIAGRYKDGMK